MTDESSALPTSCHNPEFIKFSCDLLQTALWEAAGLLTKGMAFCMAITAGLVGYVVSKDLPSPLPQLVLGAGIGTLLLFSVLAGHWISGLKATASALERLVESLSPEEFGSSPVRLSFAKFRAVAKTFAVCAILEVAMLIFGMVLLLNHQATKPSGSPPTAARQVVPAANAK